jgi:hypothetical protein
MRSNNQLPKKHRQLTAELIGLLLLGTGFLSALLYFYPSNWVLSEFIKAFYANVNVDCISTAIAILVIDKLNDNRQQDILKAQLIREMGSPDNGIALRAVKELKAKGYLFDGSLRNAYLIRANLKNANLERADLQGAVLQEAILFQANLKNANLSEANLRQSVLESSNLEGACLNYADLLNAKLQKAMAQ